MPIDALADDDFSEVTTTEKDPDEKRDPEGEGDLLTLPDEEAAVLAVKLFTRQREREDVNRRIAQWEVNRLRRQGYGMVELQKVQGQNRWIAYQSPVSTIIPGWNKADDLCEKLVNQRYVDPPGPEPIPATGEDADVEAANLAERVLRDVQSEAHLDDLTLHREAADLATTYSRAGIRYYVDPQGIRGPVRIEAHPKAVSADAPFQIPGPPQLDPMTGQPAMDPMTGQPLPPPMVDAPPPYVMRYVTEDGRLTDNRTEAAERWYPRLCGEVLTPKHYRFLPATARDVWKAEGVAIGLFRPVAEIRGMFPETAEWSEQEWRRLASYKPGKDEKDLWPEGAPKGKGADGTIDDLLVFCVTVYYRSCAAYPKGAYVCTAGSDTLLHRRPWVAEMPDGGTETLEVPLTESVMYRRGRQSEYVALMEVLGPANEQRAAVIGHLMQYLDDFANRATFYSQYGTIRPEDLDQPGRKYLPYAPGHQPVTEEMPPFPVAGNLFFGLVSQEMDTNADLTQTAQGVEDKSVTSGAHAREIRSATLVNLSGLQQNDARAYTRACRIQLQLVRAHFTASQLLGWVGEDGAYRTKYFSGMDLKSTKDVRLKKGTLTLLSAQAKAQEAVYYSTVGGNPKQGVPGIINPQELREIVGDRIGADIGLQDDPERMRVRRQVYEFMEGPPENWQPPPPVPMMDPRTGQPAVDPRTGQPVMQAALDPVLQNLWRPLPADDAPDVAMMRYTELRRAMARAKFQSFDPAWQQGLLAEYERARRAAGVATVAEQQAAQQQAAMMQQRQQQAEGAKKDQQFQAQRQDKAADRGLKQQDQQNRAYAEQQRAAASQMAEQNRGVAAGV